MTFFRAPGQLVAAVLLCFLNLTTAQAATPASELPLNLSPQQAEWLDQHPEIRIGAMDNWPPLNFINLQGQQDGFGVALFELLNKRLGGRLQLVSGEWSQLYQQVQQQQLDALLDITPKSAREEDFHFTSPYLQLPHVIVARKDAPFYADEEALRGHSVALERGFGNIDYFSELYPDIHIRQYANTSEALGAVARKEVDAYVGNRVVASYIIRNELIDSLKVHSRAGKRGSLLAIGVRKDWPVLAEILQLALSSLSDAELQGLLNDVLKQNSAWTGISSEINLTEAEQQWLKAHPGIRLASDINWPPFEYFNEQGEYKGIAADYMQLIEAKLGIEFVRSPREPWHQIVEKLKSRQLDVYSLAMETPARRDYANFTAPYISNAMVIVTRQSVDFVPGVQWLFGKKVALEQGYASHDLIKQQYPEIELKTYADTSSALLAVLRGEAFAYVGNIATTSHILKEEVITGLRISGEIPLRFELSMGVRKDWPELVGILNKALQSITAQERAAVFSRWVRLEQPSSSLPLKWIVTGLIVVLLFALAILYWNLLLKRKVKERTHQLEHQAYHDTLTGLPNRSALIAQMEQQQTFSQRNNEKLAILFIDLDDFKKVNDTLGHTVGDELLQSVAHRLKQTLRGSDVISRFGGDEFVIMLSHLHSLEDIESTCLQLLQSMKHNYPIGQRSISMSLSIGIAIYPEDGETVELLLQNADTAMYAAKNKGGDHFSFYSGQLNQQVQRRMLLEEHLAKALENNEISLHFQPVIDLATGDVSKFEALARWHNSQLGDVSPEEFIPVAEHTGLIIPLGEYVLSQSLAACRRLRGRFKVPYRISVNLSPRQLRDENFVSKCEALLNRNELPADSLMLEITEGMLLKQQERADQVLKELSRLGVLLAMDDFGTGYSSLSYLRKYPFDTLKIDKEFVQDITEDLASSDLILSIISMANSMHIDVIAEGVETEDQNNKLISMNCKKAQGFYYSRPLTEERLYQWLDMRKLNKQSKSA